MIVTGTSADHVAAPGKTARTVTAEHIVDGLGER